MPIEFQGILTVDNYNYLMGLSGLVSAFIVLQIWSKGL